MKKPSVLIVMKDVKKAGMLQYMFGSDDFSSISILPSARECFYLLEKGRIPQYIIYDPSDQPVNANDFLNLVKSAGLQIPVIFLVNHEDEVLAGELFASGAGDVIMQAGYHQNWMRELVSNIKFLEKNFRTDKFLHL
jgi:DNA-binding NtrC family response regulator